MKRADKKATVKSLTKILHKRFKSYSLKKSLRNVPPCKHE